jgi:hypothetical protein
MARDADLLTASAAAAVAVAAAAVADEMPLAVLELLQPVLRRRKLVLKAQRVHQGSSGADQDQHPLRH